VCEDLGSNFRCVDNCGVGVDSNCQNVCENADPIITFVSPSQCNANTPIGGGGSLCPIVMQVCCGCSPA
jgi:hypothetical protein